MKSSERTDIETSSAALKSDGVIPGWIRSDFKAGKRKKAASHLLNKKHYDSAFYSKQIRIRNRKKAENPTLDQDPRLES